MINSPGLEFEEERHIYRYGGEVVPSVTQLLQEFGLINFDGVPQERLDRKSWIGTTVHKAAFLLDYSRLDLDAFFADERFKDCYEYLRAYLRFRETTDFEKVGGEKRMYSRKWKFAGTPDEHSVRAAKMGRERVLIDYKCTWTMYPSTGPQLAGYDMLFEENEGFKADRRYGLLLKPTGKYDLVPFNDKGDYQDFQMCVALWWKRVNKYKTLNPEKRLSNEHAA